MTIYKETPPDESSPWTLHLPPEAGLPVSAALNPF
jgi:hypothetical protein